MQIKNRKQSSSSSPSSSSSSSSSLPLDTLNEQEKTPPACSSEITPDSVEEEVESHLRPSLLSSEAFTNAENGYKGFVNLALLLLGLVNFRLVVENLIKYGLLFISASSDFSVDWRSWPGLVISVLNTAVALSGLFIERAAFRRRLSASSALLLESLFVAFLVVAPAYAVFHFHLALGSGILAMLWSTIIWMKMVSFFNVNTSLRTPHRPASPPGSPASPSRRNNAISAGQPLAHLTVQGLLRFFIIPSLVYEVHWAQTTRIRWAWLTRRIVEAIFLSTFIYVVALQYILPILQKSVAPLETFDLPSLIERILKLSIPLLYIWLVGFYVLFHLYLNIWAEITFMGDRRFYNDWWNASNLGYFWRTWNLPVHRWMLQNIYKPMLCRNYSSTTAGFVCFFISAVFHEVVVSVPFRTLKLWAFLAMLSQLPLIFITKHLFPPGSQTGNILFWLQLVLGLPTCVIMYYAYYVSTLTQV